MKTAKIYAGEQHPVKEIKGTNPLGDKKDSMRLAENIRRYYHNAGYRNVKVWSELIQDPTPHWAVRSNIAFAVE